VYITKKNALLKLATPTTKSMLLDTPLTKDKKVVETPEMKKATKKAIKRGWSSINREILEIGGWEIAPTNVVTAIQSTKKRKKLQKAN
jgi:hypothetical protein